MAFKIVNFMLCKLHLDQKKKKKRKLASKKAPASREEQQVLRITFPCHLDSQQKGLGDQHTSNFHLDLDCPKFTLCYYRSKPPL